MGIHIVLTWVLAIRRGIRARQSTVKDPEVPENVLPPVSVIVPAWNEKGTIESNIAALKQVQYPKWELIIVAGGTDGTYAAAKQAIGEDERFRLLERGPEPKNAALAKGIQKARYDYVVLLDADCVVDPGWLRSMITPLINGADAVVGNRRPKKETWITQKEDLYNTYEYEILKIEVIQGDRSIAIKKAVLEEVGGLPTHTYAREDWDLGIRLKNKGKEIAYAKNAILYADRPTTLQEDWKMTVRWLRTLLAGLTEHRKNFLKQSMNFFGILYGYLLSIGIIIFLVFAILSALIWPISISIINNLAAMILAWIYIRHVSIIGAVSGYTGRLNQMKFVWMPVINLSENILASLIAFTTFSKHNPYYKGPRRLTT